MSDNEVEHAPFDEEQQPTRRTRTGKPRRWLQDRCNGKSKIQQELGRPFCPVCWVPPCVKLCPDILEQNVCCECFGRMGVFPEDEPCSRTWLMRKSLLIHFGGVIMSVLAATAITSDPNLIQLFPFSSGVVTGFVGDVSIQEVILHVGLTTVYMKDFYFGERTFAFDELCAGSTIGIPLVSRADCHTCQDHSSGLVLSMILGVVTYIPTIASNVNRSYYAYDVNCQKVFGTVITVFSILMSLYTWNSYAKNCFQTFYDGEITVPVLVPAGANSTAAFSRIVERMSTFNASYIEETFGVDPTQWNLTEVFPNAMNASFWGDVETEVRVAQIKFDWRPGTGLILIVIATIIKTIDVVNHFLIRTPSITRNVDEQWNYEKEYYFGGIKDEDDLMDEEELAPGDD